MLSNMKKTGLYAGTFNPFHKGHLDILQRAELIFDNVIIGVGNNPDKAFSDTIDRIKNISKVIPNEVIPFNGLLIDLVDDLEQNHALDVTIIKGLRNGDDLNYEEVQLRYMEEIAGRKIKLVFLLGDVKYSHISSSAIRKLGGLLTPEQMKKYLP